MDNTDKKLLATLEQGIQLTGSYAIKVFVKMTIESFIDGLNDQMSELAHDVMETKDLEGGETAFAGLLYSCNYEFSKLMMLAEQVVHKYDYKMPKNDFVIKQIDNLIVNNIKLSQAGLIFKLSFMEHMNDFFEEFQKKETNEKFDEIVKKLDMNIKFEEE